MAFLCAHQLSDLLKNTIDFKMCIFLVFQTRLASNLMRRASSNKGFRCQIWSSSNTRRPINPSSPDFTQRLNHFFLAFKNTETPTKFLAFKHVSKLRFQLRRCRPLVQNRASESLLEQILILKNSTFGKSLKPY